MTLAVASILLAGKMSNQKKVCYRKVMSLFKKTKGLTHITKEDLYDYETSVLFSLDMDLNCVSPIVFLERFQRIFDVDEELKDEHSKLISDLARKICRHTLLDVNFLKYRPSAIAAASIVLAMNLNKSDFTVKVAFTKLEKLNKEGWKFQLPQK